MKSPSEHLGSSSLLETLRAIWLLCFVIPCWAQSAPATHDEAFSDDKLLVADAANLTDTQIVAHPDVPMKEGVNYLWCGTVNLAWNEMIKLLGEKPRFVPNPPEVDLLNREDFTDADLDSVSYVALADFERNHVEDEIRQALLDKFGGAASPHLIPASPTVIQENDFLAYAYLCKNLSFEYRFNQDYPMNFSRYPANGQPIITNNIGTFGFIEPGAINRNAISQVVILNYRSSNDFVIKIKTKAVDDELILAKVPPEKTLQVTIESVLDYVKVGTPIVATDKDVFCVPKLNFDLTKNFLQLANLSLTPDSKILIKELTLKGINEEIRFQLNQEGSKLKSEGVVYTVAGLTPPGEKQPYNLCFDSPFLILLKRTGSEHPYFVLWIGNASLLIHEKQNVSFP